MLDHRPWCHWAFESHSSFRHPCSHRDHRLVLCRSWTGVRLRNDVRRKTLPDRMRYSGDGSGPRSSLAVNLTHWYTRMAWLWPLRSAVCKANTCTLETSQWEYSNWQRRRTIRCQHNERQIRIGLYLESLTAEEDNLHPIDFGGYFPSVGNLVVFAMLIWYQHPPLWCVAKLQLHTNKTSSIQWLALVTRFLTSIECRSSATSLLPITLMQFHSISSMVRKQPFISPEPWRMWMFLGSWISSHQSWCSEDLPSQYIPLLERYSGLSLLSFDS